MKITRFLSSYLKAADVLHPQEIVIERVAAETIGHDGQEKEALALYYTGGAQRVVLNKTMLRQLMDIFKSDEYDDWIGKRVVMFRDDNVWFQGKKVAGIRFRAAADNTRKPKALSPAPSTAVPLTDMGEEAPF